MLCVSVLRCTNLFYLLPGPSADFLLYTRSIRKERLSRVEWGNEPSGSLWSTSTSILFFLLRCGSLIFQTWSLLDCDNTSRSRSGRPTTNLLWMTQTGVTFGVRFMTTSGFSPFEKFDKDLRHRMVIFTATRQFSWRAFLSWSCHPDNQ